MQFKCMFKNSLKYLVNTKRISFLKWYFLLFLVESGITFHNLAPIGREKEFKRSVFKGSSNID